MIKNQKESSGGPGIGGLLFGSLILGGLAWYFLTPTLSKDQAIAILVAAGHNGATLAGYGDDYVIEWAKAIQGGYTLFTVQGKTYNTSSGKAA